SADISMALVVSLGKSLHLQPYAGVALPLQASLTYTGNALLAISNRYSGHSADGFSETDSFDDLLFSNDMAGSNSGEEETHLSTGQTVGWDATMPRNKNADEKEVTGIKANTAWFAGINLLLVPPDVSGFKIGVEMRSTTFNQEVKSFKQIDASTDTYNSYLLADDKIDWNTFTINLSYVLKF
ncbi:MAG: hypothetical protein SH856_10490, partial [Flavobacteriales bacterium]|nr:hypothetical protein [Flavobacteriales bacterium]